MSSKPEDPRTGSPLLDSPRLAGRWHDRPGRRSRSLSDARLAVLETLSRKRNALGISDLARLLRKSKQSVHRLVLDLQRSGLIAAYATWIVNSAPELERPELVHVLDVLRELRSRLSSPELGG